MIAQGFVEAGALVYVSSRNADECRQAAADLNADAEAGHGVAIPADLATPGGTALLVDTVRSQTSSIHAVVNNAGATWGAPLAEYPREGFDKVLDINVKAPFFLVQSLLPLLTADASSENPSRVINIASIDGIRTRAMETYAYSASKAVSSPSPDTWRGHSSINTFSSTRSRPDPSSRR